jgi:hypothetical protein
MIFFRISAQHHSPCCPLWLHDFSSVAAVHDTALDDRWIYIRKLSATEITESTERTNRFQ